MKKSRGFSLVEILIVIAIIGLLTGIIIIATNYFRTRSQDESRKADLKKLGASIVLSRADSSEDIYPISSNGDSINVDECLTQNSETGKALAKSMVTVPQDNYASDGCYHYQSFNNGTAFKLSFIEKSTGNKYVLYGIADCAMWSSIPGDKPVGGEEISSGVEDCQIAKTELITPPLPVAFSIDGTEAKDVLGRSIARLSDLDGDGKEDIAVGVPKTPPDSMTGMNKKGSVIIYGSKNNWAVIKQIDSEVINDNFGTSIDNAGDQDGDGKDDIIIGDPGVIGIGRTHSPASNGKAYLYKSSDNWTTPQIFTGKNGEELGWSVKSIKDQDGDGKKDFLIGAPNIDTSGLTDNGGVYLYSSKGNILHEFRGSSIGNSYTYEAVAIGDQDGDEKDDVLVLDPHDFPVEGGNKLGAAYLYGSKNAWSLIKEFKGDTSKPNFGSSGATIGDQDGDGKSDILIGTFAITSGQTASVYLYSSKDWSVLKTWDGNDFNPALVFTTLSKIHDQDGDGKDDIIIGSGSPWDDSSVTGTVSIFSSKDNWNLLKKFEGTSDDKDGFGGNVSWLGDQNGDNKDEVLISSAYNGIESLLYRGSVYIKSLFPVSE